MLDDETIKILCHKFFELEQRVKVLEDNKKNNYAQGFLHGIQKAFEIVKHAEKTYENVGYKSNFVDGPLKYVERELITLINDV